MVSPSTQDRIVLTVEEAAKLLRISRGLAYEMVRQGALPSIRLGLRRILVPRQALERMLDRGDRPPAEQEGEPPDLLER